MREIVAFYHLATMGHYKEVNAEILGLMKHSGLLRRLKVLNIGVVGNLETDFLYTDEKFNIRKFGGINEYEYSTMKWLREYCLKNECYVLYFANVGVSHTKDREDYYPGWRDLDCHFCIMKFDECIRSLEAGYDLVSVEWQDKPVPHFSGSFWWSTSEYIKTLPTLEEAREFGLKIIKSPRHGTEFWIGMNEHINYKSMYQTGYHWMNRPIADYYKKMWEDK